MVKAKEPLKNGNGRKEYLTIWTYWWVQTCQRFWVNEDALCSPSGDIAVMGSMRCSGALLVWVIVCVVTLTRDLGSWLSLCFLAFHILVQLEQNYTITHPTGKRCTEKFTFCFTDVIKLTSAFFISLTLVTWCIFYSLFLYNMYAAEASFLWCIIFDRLWIWKRKMGRKPLLLSLWHQLVW